MDTLKLDALVTRLIDSLPKGGGQGITEELRRNLRALLSSAFARMDLVTREEFDVQAAVLQRTQQRLEELERQVAVLEALLRGRERQDPAT